MFFIRGVDFLLDSHIPMWPQWPTKITGSFRFLLAVGSSESSEWLGVDHRCFSKKYHQFFIGSAPNFSWSPCRLGVKDLSPACTCRCLLVSYLWIGRIDRQEGIPYFPTSALRGGEHIRRIADRTGGNSATLLLENCSDFTGEFHQYIE